MVGLHAPQTRGPSPVGEGRAKGQAGHGLNVQCQGEGAIRQVPV